MNFFIVLKLSWHCYFSFRLLDIVSGVNKGYMIWQEVVDNNAKVREIILNPCLIHKVKSILDFNDKMCM